MKIEDGKNPGDNGEIPVEIWESPLDDRGTVAVIARSRKLPLAFYEVRVTSSGQPFFRAYVRDYGRGWKFDPKPGEERLRRKAKETQDEVIRRNLKNFRYWTPRGGNRCWAEYGGNIGTGREETAIFHDEDGVRLEVPYEDLAVDDRKHICRGRVFRSSNNEYWIRATIEGFTNHNPHTPILQVTNAGGSKKCEEGDLVEPSATELSPADQAWIREYIDNGCHWGSE